MSCFVCGRCMEESPEHDLFGTTFCPNCYNLAQELLWKDIGNIVKKKALLMRKEFLMKELVIVDDLISEGVKR